MSVRSRVASAIFTAMTESSFFQETVNELAIESIPLSSWIDIDLATIPLDPKNNIGAHFSRYREWIQNGMHGEMKYLERGLERRGNPRLLLPSAESILCVGIPYARKDLAPTPDRPRFARYISGPDYHEFLKTKLHSVFSRLEKHWGQKLDRKIEWKVCVDTSALLERSWAALAGLGWIGKNTLLIHPKHGSYLFLGFVLTNLKSGEGPKPLPDYCGRCERCLEGCPTGALTQSHTLDSRSCISYLTLEKRGVLDANTSPMPEKLGTWVAGCDVCQEVCPFNLKPAKLEDSWPMEPTTPLLKMSYAQLENLTETEYAVLVKNSALDRIRYADFMRNLSRAKNNQLNSKP